MGTPLENFRAHCQRMADSTPKTRVKANWTRGGALLTLPVGPMSDRDRDLWRMLAREAAERLEEPVEPVAEPDPGEVPLF